MEGGQLSACLPGFFVPDHYAAFPLPLPLQLPSQPNNKLFQMPFVVDQEETENHGGMLSSDHCGGLYPLPALPFVSSSGAATATACGGKPTAGFMPSTIGAEEVCTSVTTKLGCNESNSTWWKGSAAATIAERGKMKVRRKMREPRFCFQTRSDVDVLDDGYKWRKYGQKVVKNSLHPRSYFRCTHSNCRVKKRVERLSTDCRMVMTTYEGRHTHSPCSDDASSGDHTDCFSSF
nr:zinc finger transcription factor WRKY12 [Miscanthus lutarioriparius]